MPNQSSALAPLNQLLRKSRKWSWGSAQSKAFQAAKEALTLATALTHYNPDLDLVLDCDASPYGVGVVLSHRLEDGSMRPIAYASWSLNPVECKYSHLDKEGLAIVYEVKTPVWPQVCYRFRPQASLPHFQRIKAHTIHGICSSTTLGIDAKCIWLYHWVQAKSPECHCRSVQSVASAWSFALLLAVLLLYYCCLNTCKWPYCLGADTTRTQSSFQHLKRTADWKLTDGRTYTTDTYAAIITISVKYHRRKCFDP